MVPALFPVLGAMAGRQKVRATEQGLSRGLASRGASYPLSSPLQPQGVSATLRCRLKMRTVKPKMPMQKLQDPPCEGFPRVRPFQGSPPLPGGSQKPQLTPSLMQLGCILEPGAG